MTKEILEHSLKVYNRIVEIENVLNIVISDSGQIDTKKRIEVRVVGCEYSLILDECASDKVLSILCKEMDSLKEEFEKIKA